MFVGKREPDMTGAVVFYGWCWSLDDELCPSLDMKGIIYDYLDGTVDYIDDAVFDTTEQFIGIASGVFGDHEYLGILDTWSPVSMGCAEPLPPGEINPSWNDTLFDFVLAHNVETPQGNDPRWWLITNV